MVASEDKTNNAVSFSLGCGPQNRIPIRIEIDDSKLVVEECASQLVNIPNDSKKRWKFGWKSMTITCNDVPVFNGSSCPLANLKMKDCRNVVFWYEGPAAVEVSTIYGIYSKTQSNMARP